MFKRSEVSGYVTDQVISQRVCYLVDDTVFTDGANVTKILVRMVSKFVPRQVTVISFISSHLYNVSALLQYIFLIANTVITMQY